MTYILWKFAVVINILFFFSTQAGAVEAAVMPEDLDTALTLISSNSPDDALKTLSALLEKHPGNAVVHHKLGLLYLGGKEFEQAESYLKKAIELDPALLDAYLDIASLYKERKEFDRALNMYKQLLAADKENVNARLGIADVQRQTGRQDEAKSLLLSLVLRYPENAAVQRDTGLFFWMTGDAEQAVTYLKKGKDLAPEYFQAYMDLAFIYMSRQRTEEAVVLYQQVKEKSGDSLQVKLAEGWMNYLGHSVEEVRYIKKRLSLAEAFLARGDVSQAAEIMEKLTAIVPSEYNILFKLGLAYFQMNKIDKGIEVLNGVIKLSPKFMRAYAFLGNAYEMRGETEKAEDAYEKFLDLAGAVKSEETDKLESRLFTIHEGRILKGFYDATAELLSENKLQEAAEIFTKAGGIFPESPEIFYRLGLIYNSLGNTTKALNELTKATIIDDNIIKIHFTIASIYGNRRQFNKALRKYLKVISLDPGRQSHEAKETVQRIKGLSEKISKAEKAAQGYFEKSMALVDENPDAALSEMKKAYAEHPTGYDINVNMGRLSIKLDNIDEAILFLENARELNMAKFEANIILGDLYAKRRYNRLATERYLSALAAESISQRQRTRLEKKTRMLRENIELNSEKINSLLRKIKKNINNKRYEEAKENAINARRLARDNPNIYFALGTINALAGNTDYAKKAFARAAQLDPKRYQDHFRMGLIYEDELSLHLARREYRLVIELSGGNMQIPEVAEAKRKLTVLKGLERERRMANWHFTRGRKLAAEAKYKVALIQFEKAIDLDPTQAHYYFNLGLAHEFLNEPDTAINAYKESLKHAPDNPEVHYRLAFLYDKKGKYTKAAMYYKTSLDNIGDGEFGLTESIKERYEFLAKRFYGTISYAITLNDNVVQTSARDLEIISSLSTSFSYFLIKRDSARTYLTIAPSLIRYAKFQILFNRTSVNLVNFFIMEDESTHQINIGSNWGIQTGGLVYSDKTLSWSYTANARIPQSWTISFSYLDHHLADKNNIGMLPQLDDQGNQILVPVLRNRQKNDFDAVRKNFYLSANHAIGDISLSSSLSLMSNNVVDPDEDSKAYSLNVGVNMPLRQRLSGNLSLTYGQTDFDNIDSIFQRKRKNNVTSWSVGTQYTVDSNFTLSSTLSFSQARSSVQSLAKSVEEVTTQDTSQTGGYRVKMFTVAASVSF